MSLFGGNSDRQPAPQVKPLNLDANRAATNQQARPVPYIAGRQKVGLTWISNCWDVYASPILQKVGKKKTVTGYNYFASCAGMLGTGPMDSVRRVWMDGEVVWEGTLERAGDYTELSLGERGTLRIYWGTETQTVDGDLNSYGETHPAYRGLAYVVLLNLKLGQNRTQVPQVELEVTRYPVPTWLTAPESVEGDAQVPCVIYELLTSHRFGLGWDDSRLDLDSFDAAAVILGGEGLGISPLVTRQTPLRQLLVECLEYVDGYLVTQIAGTLGLGLVRLIAEPSSLPEVTAADLTAVPQIRPGTWSKTVNETFVTYSDRETAFEDASLMWPDPGNYAVTAERRPQTLQRPWCTRGEMAQAIAMAAGQVAGQPRLSGTLKARASRVTDLAVGDGFRLTYPPLGLDEVVVRITKRTLPSPGKSEVEMAFEQDFGYCNDSELWAPTVDPGAVTPHWDPEPNEFETLLEAPWGLPATDVLGRIIALAARANRIAIGMNFWRRQPSLEYGLVGEGEYFAVRGHLGAAYTASTYLVDREVGLILVVDSQDEEWDNRTLQDAMTGEVVMYIGDEILYPWGAELVSPGTWLVRTVRGRLDTQRQSHALNAPVWIQSRAQMSLIESLDVSTLQRYKLQPYSVNREVDLAECDPLEFTLTYRARRPYAPLNLLLEDTPGLATYPSSTDLDLTWNTRLVGRADLWTVWDTPPTDLPETVLEFWTVAGTPTKKRTVEVNPGVEAYTYTNAALLADFGGYVTIQIRAYHRTNGLLSRFYTALTLTHA